MKHFRTNETVQHHRRARGGASPRRRLWMLVGIAALLTFGSVADASQTTTWEMAGAKDFLKGKMDGVSVTWDGLLRAGFRKQEVASPDQPVIWSAVRAQDGTVYLGTGYRGAVYAVRPGGNVELLWTATEPVVFALALDAKGTLYAATSPNGKIYRFENGNAAEYFDPQTQYIWALAANGDGTVYAGTGPEGKVISVSGAGQGEEYFASGQAHITSLAFDGEGRLLAGSEPNGILYRISAKQRAFVLHDATLPEIRAILPGPGGVIYVAAMGGSVAQKQQMPAGSAGGMDSTAPTISTTVTVTAATDNQQQGNQQQGVQLPQQSGSAAGMASVPMGTTSTIYEMPGVERSAIYRINADNTVETLWSSKEENVYDLALDGGRILLATDREGRIYSMDSRGRANLLAETAQGQTTRLLTDGEGFLAATGNEGKLFRFLQDPAEAAIYESPVHDAQKVSRWGSIGWMARNVPSAGEGVRVYTRAGNSFRPDDTWSEWVAANNGAAITSPNARYLQWKAEFRGVPADAALERMTVAYLPQNEAPTVKSLSVGSQLKATSGNGAAAAQAASAAASAAYTITVSASGEADAGGPAGSTISSAGRLVEPVLQCTWEAEDPDGDAMEYTLAYRAEDENAWKTIAKSIRESTYPLEGSRLADGRYYFRVTATDAPDNSPGTARESDLVSAPVIVDQSAPRIEVLSQERGASGWSVRVRVTDATSMIRRTEMSVNAKPAVVLLPVDGISDSPQEEYVLAVNDDAADETEKAVVIKATDAAANVATARVLLRRN